MLKSRTAYKVLCFIVVIDINPFKPFDDIMQQIQ